MNRRKVWQTGKKWKISWKKIIKSSPVEFQIEKDLKTVTRVGSTDLSIFTSNHIILEKMRKVRYKAVPKVSYQQF